MSLHPAIIFFWGKHCIVIVNLFFIRFVTNTEMFDIVCLFDLMSICWLTQLIMHLDEVVRVSAVL